LAPIYSPIDTELELWDEILEELDSAMFEQHEVKIPTMVAPDLNIAEDPQY
jgi:hypothetical protein